ncbi:MAG: hypothetical protein WC220_02410 [Pedobacter sp.]|jgi:hypothetical protein
MKKIFYSVFALAFFTGACNSTDTAEKAKQDSIAEAAAADSMLKAAVETDTLKADTITIDSIK